MGLGALAEVGLMEARAKAADCRALRAKNIDPIDHAKAAKAQRRIAIASSGPTFEDVAEEYMAERLVQSEK